MKKTYAILVAVIFLISVSAVFAADSSKEIFLGGVKFSVPSTGEFNPDNTGYHTDKFGIDLIQDNSLPDEQNTIKNSSLTKMTLYHRDVLAIYSKSSDDFNVFRQQKNQPDYIFWLIFVSICSISSNRYVIGADEGTWTPTSLTLVPKTSASASSATSASSTDNKYNTIFRIQYQ